MVDSCEHAGQFINSMICLNNHYFASQRPKCIQKGSRPIAITVCYLNRPLNCFNDIVLLHVKMRDHMVFAQSNRQKILAIISLKQYPCLRTQVVFKQFMEKVCCWSHVKLPYDIILLKDVRRYLLNLSNGILFFTTYYF